MYFMDRLGSDFCDRGHELYATYAQLIYFRMEPCSVALAMESVFWS